MTVCDCVPFQGRDILMRMMEVFILKFQFIADYKIPEIFARWYEHSDEVFVLEFLLSY